MSAGIPYAITSACTTIGVPRTISMYSPVRNRSTLLRDVLTSARISPNRMPSIRANSETSKVCGIPFAAIKKPLIKSISPYTFHGIIISAVLSYLYDIFCCIFSDKFS